MDGHTLKQEVWTPLRVIQWAVPFLAKKGIETARLDAECLMGRVIGTNRLGVYLQYDRPLTVGELSLMREWLTRRAGREPLHYILGFREFCGLEMKVTPAVLIPRPETEMLVEACSDYLKDLPEEGRTILELGTGSGCVSIALAKRLPVRIWATDRSPEALRVAGENAIRLGAGDRIEFRAGDWFGALQDKDPQAFQAVVSNPPYIPLPEREGLEPEIRNHEPGEALFGGENGLEAYQKILAGLSRRLKPGGRAFIELNANIHSKITGLFEALGEVEVTRDIQGLPRLLTLKKPC